MTQPDGATGLVISKTVYVMKELEEFYEKEDEHFLIQTEDTSLGR